MDGRQTDNSLHSFSTVWSPVFMLSVTSPSRVPQPSHFQERTRAQSTGGGRLQSAVHPAATQSGGRPRFTVLDSVQPPSTPKTLCYRQAGKRQPFTCPSNTQARPSIQPNNPAAAICAYTSSPGAPSFCQLSCPLSPPGVRSAVPRTTLCTQEARYTFEHIVHMLCRYIHVSQRVGQYIPAVSR